MGAPGPLVKRLGLRGKELVFFDVEWGSNHEPRASEEDAQSTSPRPTWLKMSSSNSAFPDYALHTVPR